MIRSILTTGLVSSALLNAVSEDRPNILWITSEDNSVDYIGCYGNEMINTPNIDKLAAEGFRYTNCYSNAAVCSPSRSTWITGMIASSVGSHNHRSSLKAPNAVKPYPMLLKEAGYYTTNGKKTDYNIPFNQGKLWDKGNPEKWSVLKNKQPFFQVINLFDSHESKAMSTKNKHDKNKVVLPPYYPDTDIVRKNTAFYYDSIKKMDSKLGNAVKGLEKAGLADNTIVIYCSDHGGALPRGKRFMYNSGTHAPLIVRIPAKYKKWWPNSKTGTTVDRLVSFVDMPATWLSLAGAKIPENYQGRIFLGDHKDPEAEYHYSFRGRNDERVENARAIRDKQFLFVKNYIPYVPRGQKLTYQWKIPLQREWEKCFKEGTLNKIQSRYFQTKPQYELYDIIKDPHCLENLASKEGSKERVQMMNKKLMSYQQKIHDAGLIPESEVNKRAKDNSMTVYELIRKESLYNLSAYQQAAETTLEKKTANIPVLTKYLSHKDSGIRYWGATGLMMLGKEAAAAKPALKKLLSDESHNVRAMAAWALIKLGVKEPAYKAIKEMINSKSYALMEILNIVDWMEEDGKPLHSTVKNMKSKDRMIQWIKQDVLD